MLSCPSLNLKKLNCPSPKKLSCPSLKVQLSPNYLRTAVLCFSLRTSERNSQGVSTFTICNWGILRPCRLGALVEQCRERVRLLWRYVTPSQFTPEHSASISEFARFVSPGAQFRE